MLKMFYYFGITEKKKFLLSFLVELLVIVFGIMMIALFKEFWLEELETLHLFMIVLIGIIFVMNSNIYVYIFCKNSKSKVIQFISIMPIGLEKYIYSLVCLQMLLLIKAYVVSLLLALSTECMIQHNLLILYFKICNVMLLLFIMLLILELLLCVFIEQPGTICVVANLVMGGVISFIAKCSVINQVISAFHYVIIISSMMISLMFVSVIAIRIIKARERIL